MAAITLTKGTLVDSVRVLYGIPEFEQAPMVRTSPAFCKELIEINHAGKTIGCAAYNTGFILGYEGVNFQVMAILPEFRKQGYGSEALGLLERRFVDNHQAVLVTGIPNDNYALDFFTKRGYSRYGRGFLGSVIVKSLQPDILLQSKIEEQMINSLR